jgi:hypothetical protein
MATGVVSLRTAPWKERVFYLSLMLFAILIHASILESLIVFWSNPYTRGVLIRF